jgi:hypothetical protein
MQNRIAGISPPPILVLTFATIVLGTLDGARGVVVDNSFNAGTEGWQIYDYNGQPFGVEGGNNVFYPVTWESSGGVGNSGYVWGDDSRWRIDTPETPDSILSFIIYRSWVGAQPIDLRNKTVSVYLRGDNLDLKGATCDFWVYTTGTRWHYTSHPLTIEQGDWGQKQTFVLTNNESLWHNSWWAGSNSLDATLANATSYGFAFVGFPYGAEVTGKCSMDQFTISTPEPTSAGMLAAGGVALLATLCWRKRPRPFGGVRIFNATASGNPQVLEDSPSRGRR